MYHVPYIKWYTHVIQNVPSTSSLYRNTMTNSITRIVSKTAFNMHMQIQSRRLLQIHWDRHPRRVGMHPPRSSAARLPLRTSHGREGDAHCRLDVGEDREEMTVGSISEPGIAPFKTRARNAKTARANASQRDSQSKYVKHDESESKRYE